MKIIIFAVCFSLLISTANCRAMSPYQADLPASVFNSEADLFQKIQTMSKHERRLIINDLFIKIGSLENQLTSIQNQIDQIKKIPHYQDLQGTVVLCESGRNTVGIVGLVGLFMGYIDKGPGEVMPKQLTYAASTLLALAVVFHAKGSSAEKEIRLTYPQIDRYQRALEITRKEVEYEKNFIEDLSQSFEIIDKN